MLVMRIVHFQPRLGEVEEAEYYTSCLRSENADMRGIFDTFEREG
jgi:hypothetical protein